MRTAVVLALLLPAAAPTIPSAGFAFGRSGGNIMPFTVLVDAKGGVHASGAAPATRSHVTHARLVRLVRAAHGFQSLPAATDCPSTLPDVASELIRVGTRTVRVHGGCVAGFNRLWKALNAAVRPR